MLQLDKEMGQKLLDEADKALKIISEYTKRMKREEKERKEIDEHLDTFIWHQQKELYSAKVKQKVKCKVCSWVILHESSHFISSVEGCLTWGYDPDWARSSLVMPLIC